MRSRGFDGVFKIVNMRRRWLAPVAVINPCMRVLVYEQRRRAADVCVACVFYPVSFPRVPRKRLDWVSGRADCEQVKNFIFAVIAPDVFYESGFRSPAMCEQRRMAVLHPFKINALVNQRREPDYLQVF